MRVCLITFAFEQIPLSVGPYNITSIPYGSIIHEKLSLHTRHMKGFTASQAVSILPS